jgi:apolipoprotein N-acyltransferase
MFARRIERGDLQNRARVLSETADVAAFGRKPAHAFYQCRRSFYQFTPKAAGRDIEGMKTRNMKWQPAFNLLSRIFHRHPIPVDYRMKLPPDHKLPLGWSKSLLWMLAAIVCFHLAYTPLQHPVFGLFIFGYALCLTQLTHQKTVRRAFYFGLATGFLCIAPQLVCFWNIFSAAAIVLWLVLAFWIGLFVAIVCACIRRWGRIRAMWLVPFIWTGLEYFRSELYYLKFSWLNVGYVFPHFQLIPIDIFGMYSVGFIVFFAATVYCHRRLLFAFWYQLLVIYFVLLVPLAAYLHMSRGMIQSSENREKPTLHITGVQLEFPPEGALPIALNGALKKNPDARIFVLSEYTLLGPVPESLKEWCRQNSRYLVVGGEDPAGTNNYYDTAFVIGTNGDIVFKQAKSVPIQFFRDGLPAQKQELWNSPWGKIGFCICYDLSYTRVTDELVKQGAQLLIVPTMDVAEWGRHEHELHALVAPVRAAEYGIPIFRLASSGISQAVGGDGHVIAQAPFPGSGEILSANLRLPTHGSIPLDRYLAPFCSIVTAVVVIVLAVSSFRGKRLAGKAVS